MNKDAKNKGKIKGFLSKHIFAIIAFLIPVVIMTIVLAIKHIYPFGSHIVAVVDMYHQYMPFYSDLLHKMHTGGNLFYSWNGAGGYNFFGMLAYYGASPLNLLLFLFPSSLLVEGITLIMLLKLGFAGLFMYMFLINTYGKVEKDTVEKKEKAGKWESVKNAVISSADELLAVAFSSMYALSSYMLAFYWCTMWLDVVALVPLCILGLHRLLDGKNPLLYTITLAFCVFCNYYIAFMLCIFIVLYYLKECLANPRTKGFVSFAKTSGYVALYSVIGVGLAAVMALPAYYAIKNTYYSSSDWPSEWAVRADPLKTLMQLFPSSSFASMPTYACIYAGTAVVLLMLCFFGIKKIPFREKAANALILLFMLFSITANIPDFIWHGLHYPNSLPVRYAYLITFLTISVAYRTMLHIKELDTKTLWTAVIGASLFLIISYQIVNDLPAKPIFYICLGIAYMTAYALLIAANKNDALKLNYMYVLFAFVMIAEIGISTHLMMQIHGAPERDPYYEKTAIIDKLLAEEDEGFSRTETMTPTIVVDGPMMYHYKGIGQFSSTLNVNGSYMMEDIGMPSTPGSNTYYYFFSNPLTHAMLGVNYVIAFDEPATHAYFSEKTRTEGGILYQNDYPLSVGYMVPSDVKTWNFSSERHNDTLNDYCRSITGGRVVNMLQDIGEYKSTSGNIQLTKNAEGQLQSVAAAGVSGDVNLEYPIETAGTYYVSLKAKDSDNAKFIISGKSEVTNNRRFGEIACAGYADAGDTLTVNIHYKEGKGGDINCTVLRFDDDMWNKVYSVMSKNQLNVTEYGDNYIKGTIHADEDGVMMTSVIYEKDWKLYVDGVKTDINLLCDSLISADIKAGDHEIELRYTPGGFKPGAMFSIEFLILLLLLRFISKKKRHADERSEDGEV